MLVHSSPRHMQRTAQSNQSRARRFASERGTALLAALCFATVLAMALGSYLTLCSRSLQMSSRNMNSAHSLELAETGMEETLWALNANSSTGDWTGWTIAGTTATKTLSGFAYDNGVTGSINLKVTNYTGTSGTRTVTVTGTTTLADGSTTSRTLTSTSAQAPMFVNAVAGTTGTVTFNSGGTADSYDSSLGTYASQTPTYAAILASNAPATTTPTVTPTNAQIKGYVASLYTGNPGYSSSGQLVGPTTPVGTKIDTNRVSSSPYQPLFDIKTPTGAGSTLNNPTTNTVTHIGTAGATTPALYYCSGLDMTGTAAQQISVDGPVQLVMTGGGAFYIGLHGGSPSIQVAAGASLEVFTTGDIAIYGGGISNASQLPKNVAIYGTTALTVPDMSTTTPFYGVIYTPTGNFTVAGNAAIYGALVAKKVTFSGTAPAVHYDLNLRQAVFPGLDTPFAVSNWNETSNP
jgi:hypothetical protein